MDASIKQLARERMKGHCRVCPQCDGRVCAGEVPGMGGLGTGSSFRANMEAVLGEGRCHVLSIRQAGGVRLA